MIKWIGVFLFILAFTQDIWCAIGGTLGLFCFCVGWKNERKAKVETTTNETTTEGEEAHD